MVHLTLAKASKSLLILFCFLMFNSLHLNNLRQRLTTANRISSAAFMGYCCLSVQGALLKECNLRTANILTPSCLAPFRTLMATGPTTLAHWDRVDSTQVDHHKIAAATETPSHSSAPKTWV